MVFDWEGVDFIRAILTVTATIPCGLFLSAGFWHFGGAHKSGTGLVSLASALGYIAILYTIWFQGVLFPWPIFGIALQCFSLFVFGWCIGTSGRSSLALAFSTNSSRKLLRDGPYAVVRHPFYTSYILFWIGGLATAPSIFTIATTALLIVIYYRATRSEDRELAEIFSEEFPDWYKNTGTFFPKFH